VLLAPQPEKAGRAERPFEYAADKDASGRDWQQNPPAICSLGRWPTFGVFQRPSGAPVALLFISVCTVEHYFAANSARPGQRLAILGPQF
jgi:hypothetical protein